MKKQALFGYTGFVGSYLCRHIPFDYLYNSKNIKEAINMDFDTIYISCIPAVKWIANKNPENDILIINKIKEILETIKANKVILISTIDIYDNINNKSNENTKIDYLNNHTYGKNRYFFELFIKNKFKNHHIIRLPALFGVGLKKNIIYDLLNNNNVDKIYINSSFQWYNLEWLSNDIDIIIKNNLKTCNLFTEPLETKEIIKLFPLYDYSNNPESLFRYDVGTINNKYFLETINYIRSKNIVLNNIKEFIDKNKTFTNFNLCVSNICNNFKNEQFYRILNSYNIKYLEIAPTKYGKWDELFSDFKEKENINKHNLELYSFQSISYTINDNIFEKNNNLLGHIKKVIDLAIINGVKNLVFGCPKNRNIPENMDNIDIFIEFMRDLGNYIGERDLIISIENNSKKYNCNFLNTITEIGEMCKLINHKNIKIMIDLGNCIMEDDEIDDILKYPKLINHIHISVPYMKDFIDYNEEKYIKFKLLLQKINYNKIISLEFLNNSNLEYLNKSLSNFTKL